jgi:hypothetical protein
MKPEVKAALKAGGTTALIAGAAAAMIANPVCWGAALYGAYRMGKEAYKDSKAKQAGND